MNHPETRADSTADHSAQAPQHAPRPTAGSSVGQAVRQLLRRPATSAIAMLGLPGLAFAGPEGGNVVHGAADITRPDANTTNIDQLTNRAIINWDSFNVGADEFVIFNQLDASSIVLNRVLGGDASVILGHIEANGQVFLLNPQGVFFGEGASIDVQGFLASTLDMSDESFINGEFELSRTLDAGSTGQVVNEGTITAGEGGYVLLAGDFTENTGVVTAMAGTVALVSGDELTLNIEGDGLVNFSVNAATLAEASGVHNAGSLIADGGMVVMTARVANDLVATAVNNEGLVRARSIENEGGEIWLVGHGGDVEQSGTLDASGVDGDGGQMLVRSNTNVLLADGGVQTVDGDTGFNAGDARFIGEETLTQESNNVISALGETGGRVEVSGYGGMTVAGVQNIGAGGNFILDPEWIAIDSFTSTPTHTSSSFAWSPFTPATYDNTESVTLIGIPFITTQLNSNVDVTLVAQEAYALNGSLAGFNLNATGTGDLAFYIGDVATGGSTSFGLGLAGGVFGGSGVTVNPSTDTDPSHSISLSSFINQISIAGNFTASIAGGGTDATISLPDITANNVTINAGSGTVALSGAVNGASGSVQANGDVTITGSTIQNVYVNRANNVVFNGDYSGSYFTAGSSGTVLGSSSGNIGTFTVNGNVNATNWAWIQVAPSGSINITGAMNIGSVATLAAGINQASPSGSVMLNGINAGGNIQIHGGTNNLSGQYLTTGTITVGGNGNITGNGFSFGTSPTPVAGISINGGINNTGDVVMYADDISNASINITGNLITTGNVSLNVQGSSGANPSITLGGFGSAGGNMNMTATAGSGGGGSISVGSGLVAGGNINLTANGTTGFQAGYIDILVGGISAGGSVNLSATGGSNGGGVINVVGSGPKGIAGNGITVTATGTNGQSVGGSAGSINISGQVQGGTGNVNISATGTGIGTAGNINISGNGSAGHIRGQSVSIFASGVNGGGRIDLGLGTPESSFQGALVTAQTGNASITAAAGEGVINAGSINAAGNVSINNTTGQGHVHIGDYSGGGAVFTPATITAGGNFDASIGGSVTAFDFGAISAGSNLTMNLTGGIGHSFDTLTAGGLLDVNLTAISNITINNATGGSIDFNLPLVNLNLGQVETTDASGTLFIDGQNVSITDSSIVAAGDVILTASSNLSLNTPTISAGGFLNVVTTTTGGTDSFGDLSATNVTIQTQGASLVTGNITANNSASLALVQLNTSGGNITVNGDLTVSGMAGGTEPLGAVAVFNTQVNNSNSVTVTGTTTLTGNAGTVTGATNAVNGGTETTSGNIGGALLLAETQNGTVNFGDINVSADGFADIVISGQTIDVGNVTANVAAGSYTRTTIRNTSSFSSSATETVSSGGGLNVDLIGDTFNSAAITLGNVNLTGPQVGLNVVGFATLNGGSVNLTATGVQSSMTVTGSDFIAGSSFSLNETRDGGAARLLVAGEPGGGSANFGGDINVSAQAGAIVDIISDVVSLQNVDAVATGGTFTRTGSPNPYLEDKSPFGDSEGGGPRINEGTITGGEALIRISSQTPDGTFEAASSVSAGDISVTAMGSARIEIFSQTVGAGNITGTATLSTRNGTFDNTFSSGGSTFQESGTVSGSYGDVDVVIENGVTAGNITLGNVSLNGPVAGGHIGGANVTMGDFSLTGTGINLDVTETRTNLTAGTSESFTFQGDALLTGMGLEADNSLQLGNINISGVGAAGALLSGVNVQTGNVTINVTDADIVAQQQNFFGGALTSFTAGNAVFGIDAGSATVSGTMNISATGGAHVGGTFDVTGDVAISAGRAYTTTIPQTVQFLNAVRDDEGGGNLVLPGPLNVTADNIGISAGTQLNLSDTVLTAPGNITLSAGTNMLVTNISLNGGVVVMEAGGNISNSLPPGVITADAIAITAGGNINLPNITFNIGSGSIAGVTGDATLVSLLGAEGLAPDSGTPNAYFSGNNVSLGNLSMTGDYLFIRSNTLSLAGFTGSDPSMLVQLTSVDPAASIGVEDQPANTSTVNYSNADILSLFAGQTIAIGTTDNTGDINIGRNGSINIGSTNFFALSRGTVTGIDKIISTGIVKDLDTLLGTGFEVPQTDEIDVSQSLAMELERDYSTDGGGEGEEEGEEEGEDTDDDTGVEEEDDSLIRQDTIDEELTCS